MTDSPSFLDDPDDTREQIMGATYRALCEHGYSDLTIQRISDEFAKSKSLLYHHYDSKDELLLEFLEFMLDRVEDRAPRQEIGDAEGHIEGIVDEAFEPGGFMDDDFWQAFMELRIQAAHDERYREHFARSDRFLRDHVAFVIQLGIEQGVFRDVDPDEAAALFRVVFDGATLHRVTSDEDVLAAGRAAFRRYVRDYLLREE